VLLCLGIFVGILAGVIADYLMVRYGWKPSVVVVTLVATVAFVWLRIDDGEPFNALALMLACSSTRFYARPLFKWRLGRA
jgi:hypothetical protein